MLLNNGHLRGIKVISILAMANLVNGLPDLVPAVEIMMESLMYFVYLFLFNPTLLLVFSFWITMT